jgi:hypothetical protein
VNNSKCFCEQSIRVSFPYINQLYSALVRQHLPS